MKIVGVISWYDESPSWLAAAVAGFGRVCDEIVAIDGAYALFPGARPRSHPVQAEAILQTCESIDVACTIHRPRHIFFGNEVEKRNLSLRYAGANLTAGKDFVLIFDGDYHIIRCEPEAVRWDLEQTDCNVASYTLLDGMDALATPGIAERAVEIPVSTEWTGRTRDIYRWTPDLAYGPAHFTLSGTYDGVKQWLRGPELVKAHDSLVRADCHDLNAALVAVHRTQHRAMVRREAAEGYYQARDAAQIETITDGWGVEPVAA